MGLLSLFRFLTVSSDLRLASFGGCRSALFEGSCLRFWLVLSFDCMPPDNLRTSVSLHLPFAAGLDTEAQSWSDFSGVPFRCLDAMLRFLCLGSFTRYVGYGLF